MNNDNGIDLRQALADLYRKYNIPLGGLSSIINSPTYYVIEQTQIYSPLEIRASFDPAYYVPYVCTPRRKREPKKKVYGNFPMIREVMKTKTIEAIRNPEDTIYMVNGKEIDANSDGDDYLLWSELEDAADADKLKWDIVRRENGVLVEKLVEVRT